MTCLAELAWCGLSLNQNLRKRYRILLKNEIHLRGVSDKESPNSPHNSWKQEARYEE